MSAVAMRLDKRQQASQTGDGTDKKTIVIVLTVVISIFFFSILFCFWYFNRRAKRLQHEHGYSKRKSWRESINSISSSLRHSLSVRSDVLDGALTALGGHRMQDVETGAGVDRHTSVRSIMTLPAYSAVPRENEGVIAKEGERGGMDTVVEFPETVADEEERREEEMESLYQIRLARRQEADARQERRRLRREARERGDEATLQTLRRESRRARNAREISGSEALIAEHESRPRERRVSAVSYSNLGVARHDGSRVRASGESERPLLDAAGEIDMSGPIRPWVTGDSTSHRRGGSSFTDVSMTSYGSDNDSNWSDNDSTFDALNPERSRTRSRSRPRSRARTLSQPASVLNLPGRTSAAGSRASSRGRNLSIDTSATAAVPLPTSDPPPYSGTLPPYSSPVAQRPGNASLTSLSIPAAAATTESATGAPRLPPLEHVPSIEIIANTPIEPPRGRRSVPNFSMRRDSQSTSPTSA